jgi:hypothetical protein
VTGFEACPDVHGATTVGTEPETRSTTSRGRCVTRSARMALPFISCGDGSDRTTGPIRSWP